MFIVLIRTVILYMLVVVVMRLMGKRQIGELQPYEYVITIMISDLAALPMQDTRLPLLLGIVPIITLLFIKNVLSSIQLKNQLTRKIVDGEPCILICKSKINYKALKYQQITIDELLEALRLLGYFNLDDIQYAILENNGNMSILPTDFNNSSANSTSADNNNSINKKAPILPKILVTDGAINKNSLTRFSSDKQQVEKELKKHGINSMKEVLLAMYDTNGDFKYQLFDEYQNFNKKGGNPWKLLMCLHCYLYY